MIHQTNKQIKIRTSQALNCFFKRITEDLKDKFSAEVEIQILGDLSFNKYDINSFKDKTQSLVVIGTLDDLNDKAVLGLVAHLYGLIYINYDKNPVPKEKEWLKVDLYSDEIAKSWGFKEEVEELRKTRPQKIPMPLNYEVPILEHSVPDFEFKKDLSNILNKISGESFMAENRILYTGKYSSVCNIESLRKCLIKHLYIITSSYIQDKKILDSLLVTSS